MKVGFVVAMEEEYRPFLKRLGTLVAEDKVCGIDFCTYTNGGPEIVLAKCGIGEIGAACATGLLIGHFGCTYIVNFGLVGSLDGRSLRSIVAVQDVVHYDCDITAFGHAPAAPADIKDPFIPADPKMLELFRSRNVPVVRLASGDKFVADAALKNKLKADFSAQICDMEGAGVALTCARAGVPFSMIKVISDSADSAAAILFGDNKKMGFDFAVNVVLTILKRF